MQIVINIPKEIYELCVTDDYFFYNETDTIRQAIKNGVPLTKGHGKIVDTKNFKNYLRNSYIDSVGFERAVHAISQLKTIIEADKESEE